MELGKVIYVIIDENTNGIDGKLKEVLRLTIAGNK